MGLRFRKSITLCKGVRLNVGKTGVSISSGIPGFRRTIHSSGRVTTSIGIPGTGIYYVDTKNPNKDKSTAKQKQLNQTPAYTWQPKDSSTPIAPPTEKPMQFIPDSINSATDKTPVKPTTIVQDPSLTIIPTQKPEPTPIPDVVIPDIIVTKLFEHCDYPVKWIDVLCYNEPPEDGYDLDTWNFLRSKVLDVFDGNVDVMLEIIENINPYDDLLDYLADFEFEADNAECLEIGCRMLLGNLGTEKEDAAASLIIRLARDTFALLPVTAVRIRINNTPPSIISDVYLERDLFAKTIFENKDPSDLLKSLHHTPL